MSGMGGRSPPRGGAAVDAANQQLLVDSDQEAADDRQAGTNAEADNSQKASKRRKVCTVFKSPNIHILDSSGFDSSIAWIDAAMHRC